MRRWSCVVATAGTGAGVADEDDGLRPQCPPGVLDVRGGCLEQRFSLFLVFPRCAL